ncbi:kappa-type opioid receptor-like [Glandiceps talaboti]
MDSQQDEENYLSEFDYEQYRNNTNTTSFDYHYTCFIIPGPILIPILLLGIIGNATFLFVVTRIKSMRTLPNLYFVNLALADFGVLLSYLITEYRGPLQLTPPIVIRMTNVLTVFLLVTCLCVSLISVSMISLERYLAICHPYKAIQLRQKFRVMVLLVLSWVVGAIPGTVVAVCLHTSASSAVYVVCIMMVTCVALVALFLVVIFYMFIAREISQLRRTRVLPDALVKEEKRVVALCMVIAALFFILISPKVVVLVLRAVDILNNVHDVDYCLIRVTWYLIILHFTLNPILYNAGSQNHRRAFQLAFSGQSERSRRASTTRTTGINGTENKQHNVQVEENLM